MSVKPRTPLTNPALEVLSLVLTLIAFQSRSALAGGCPGGGKAPATDIPVTTVIGDLDSNGAAADISSDGLGPYRHNVDGVSSILTPNGYNCFVYGDWQFDTYSSTARRVNHGLDTDDAALPGDPHYTTPANPPFWGTQSLKSHIEVKCTLIHNDMLTMTAGSSFTCPLLNRFNTAGNIDYGLSPAYSFTGYPETTDAQVICNTADSGGCNDWFIDPIVLGEAVGRLTTASTSKKAGSGPVDDGDFYMRFHIHITRL